LDAPEGVQASPGRNKPPVSRFLPVIRKVDRAGSRDGGFIADDVADLLKRFPLLGATERMASQSTTRFRRFRFRRIPTTTRTTGSGCSSCLAAMWTAGEEHPHWPELPNPFSAREDSSREATSSMAPVSTGTGIICAIFSPALRLRGMSPRLVIRMRISPR